LLVPKKGRKGMRFICRRCGKRSEERIKIAERKVGAEKVVSAPMLEVAPRIRIKCPSCGNMGARYWLLQTRAADEPPTRFYRCTRCEHTWREYK
jgi:DNA-directed RNA polymerase subunit M